MKYDDPRWYTDNVPPDHHHPEHEWIVDRCADRCDDQLPLFSRVGRGLRGDGYKVELHEPTECETYLEGMIHDAATGTYHTDWMSENINGGHLLYQYNLRPYSNPQTFTITFQYDRPGREDHEWSWTTPAIPYIWDVDNDGLADVDGIVGTGVATLFLKKTTDGDWVMTQIPTSHTMAEAADRQEKPLYPEDWLREMFNAPAPGDPWTVNLTYGIGGDIDAPNIEDLARVLGISIQNIRDIIENSPLPTATIPDDNLKEYIDRRDTEDLTHIHEDMGFDDILVNDGDADTATPKRNTIKKWIDWIISRLGFGPDIDTGNSDNVKDYIDDSYDNILDHLHADLGGDANELAGDDSDTTNGWVYTQKYGPNAGTTTLYQTVYDYINAVADDLAEGIAAAQGKADSIATWINNNVYGSNNGCPNTNLPSNMKIPTGNINVLSSTTSNAIITHTGDRTGDIKAE